jgi:spore coat polysaccharide biosynthesis protein SpsF
MKTVAIVQARMGSTRLPGKVLRPLCGRPMLAQQVRRIAACTTVSEIVLATTTAASDNAIADLASELGVRCFRGSEQDVLWRFVGAARATRAEVVVRLTADCPLIDPQVIDGVVRALQQRFHSFDYAANVLERSYPRGLDAEALFMDVLERMHRIGRTPSAREHVTLDIRQRPDLFACYSVVDPAGDNSDLRWTVDTVEDFALVERLYEDLGLGETLRPYHEVLAHVRANPQLATLNAHIQQKVA